MRLIAPFFLVSVALAAPSLHSAATTVQSCENATITKIGKRKIEVANKADRLFFGVGELALDFDGSPVAYGVRDQGQENICVGLAPSTGACRGKFQGACYHVCQQTFATWSRSGKPTSAIADTMCSVGLGGGNCSAPDVRLQLTPHQDFFVSETSLKTSPITGPLNAAWIRGQAAQLDPAQIRYLVLPGSLMKAPFRVHLGDVGVAYNVANGIGIPFIVGDGGGLGEGSVSLLKALLPSDPPNLTKGMSALGEPVDRYKAGITGDFRFVIFKGSASLVQGSVQTTQRNAAELPNWIDQTAKALLYNRSTYAEVKACSAHRNSES